jgi:hypothetical protein
MVQLILVLELPFTLILGSIVLGGSLRTQGWTAIATMTVGVVLLLSMLEPRGGDPYSTAWVPITPSRDATCTYSCTRPPRRSRRSGRTVAPEGGGVRPAGGC